MPAFDKKRCTNEPILPALTPCRKTTYANALELERTQIEPIISKERASTRELPSMANGGMGKRVQQKDDGSKPVTISADNEP